MNIAILCIGNRLMLDDGAGPAVYDELIRNYRFGSDVQLFDAGCMTMDLLPQVMAADFVIVVDAVDGTQDAPGTVFRFSPDDVAGHGVMQSLHDMRLSDLLAAAELLGHKAQGVCFGVQVENMSPDRFVEGLTPKVHAALPLLVNCVLAELMHLGTSISNADGSAFVPPSATAAKHASEPAKPNDFDLKAKE